METKWIFVSLFLIANVLVFGQEENWIVQGRMLQEEGQYDKSLDPLLKAYQFYKKNGNAREMTKASLGLGFSYVNLHNITESLTYYKIAYELSRKHHWIVNEKEAADAISSMYYLTGQPQEAIPYAHRCVEIGLISKDPMFHSTKMMELGYLYLKTGLVDSAEIYLHRSLALKEEIKDKDGAVIVQNYLGEFYKSIGDLDKAQEYNFINLNHWQEVNDSVKLVTTYYNISSIFYEMGDYKKSESYALESLNLSESLNLVLYKSFGIKRLAEINIKKNQVDQALNQYLEVIKIYEITEHKTRLVDVLLEVADIYLTKKDFGLAAQYLQKAKRYESLTKDVKTKTKVKLFQSKYYAIIGKPQNAYTTSIEAFEIADKAGLLLEKTEAAFYISQSFSSLGNTVEALDWHKKYTNLKDSLALENQQNSIHELETKYRVKQKQEQIQKLNTEQELSDLKLKAASRNQLLLSGGIVLLSIITGISFFFYRTKKRDNLLLAEKNEIIKSSLSEKELLVQEIHHRVKNNLQTISSLLNMQSYNLKDPEALKAIKKGESRIKSMALIHENLFQDHEKINLNASEYIESLALNLFNTYSVSPEKIKLNLDISAVHLDLDRMIALGLILNELISNALQHAFSDRDEGQINVMLVEQSDMILLQVADNGVGLPENYLTKKSLGFQLINDFVKKLKGKIMVNNLTGTNINIYIPKM